MRNYAYCWAQDVLAEIGHNDKDEKAIGWVLRWMARNWLEPEEESVTSISDRCKEDFNLYIQKRNLRAIK